MTRTEWTVERIEQLATEDVRQLRVNADRLCNRAIVERCDEVLSRRLPERRPRRQPAR